MKRAVFFLSIWPEPRSSAAGLRTLELVGALRDDGWEVTAVSPGRDNEHRITLEQLGCRTLTADPNDGPSCEPLRALAPSLVIFDRFMLEEQFGWRAREAWPAACQLVDTIDLHSVRRAREQLVKQGAEWATVLEPPLGALGEGLVRELSSLYRADGALVVSTWERDFLLRLGYPPAQLLYLPLEGRIAAQPAPFAPRTGFCFLGNFRHAPNADAVRWLLAELWPRLRARRPDFTLHLYGAYPPASVSQLHGRQGILAPGPVEDHRGALQRHRVLLAPLRFGAGIKGKVLEAWGTGTPVLGTEIAFEGMGQGAGRGFRSPEAFAAEAEALHENPSLWQQESERGLAHLGTSFDPARLRAEFLAYVEQAGQNAPKWRETNLVGLMLRHHQANSLKYFSRWLEEKAGRAAAANSASRNSGSGLLS